MSETLYFRLAGPVQSWAGPAITGNFVRTQYFPTHSGLVGLIAGVCGFTRGDWPEWIHNLHFDVRIDQRGHILRDFHTIAVHDDEMKFRKRLVAAMGKRPTDKMIKLTPDAQGLTSVVERTYIAGGEFIVRVAPPAEHLAELTQQLRAPDFSTYLGRKAFPPAFPFFLGAGTWEDFTKIPVYDPLCEDETKAVEFRSHGVGTSNSPTRIYPRIAKDRSSWLKQTSDILSLG